MDTHRGTDRLLLVAALALIVGGWAWVLWRGRSPAPAARMEASPAVLPAMQSGAAEQSGLPLVHAVGAERVSDVPRYPGARLLEGETMPIWGLKAARMVTEASPREVALYYTRRLLAAGYAAEDQMALSTDGEGWFGSFAKAGGAPYVGIVAMSRWIDLPPGGATNPTTISIVTVTAEDLDVQALQAALEAP